ncbi:MAG: crotonobetainyl-CoA--carnitine CoA-transferase [Deltaproteobacteria bacterium]|nr:crotonobetainyl-CoA--carnitine CoA-transferase [Deltaproteobacteria bacterium]
MKNSGYGNITYEHNDEKTVRREFLRLFKSCPIPDDELLSNLGLFLNSKNLARILFMQHLYTQIADMPGIIIEFGTRWGQNLSLFSAMRGIYDTFHRHRKIVGFDTFEGFPSIHEKDGTSNLMKEGTLSVSKDYAEYLRNIIDCQEKDNPLSHIKKHEVIQGDAVIEFEKYLKDHPETIVALAYFDFDIYEPTKKCLELIKPHLTKGSVLGFDELNDPDSPGETVALAEVFGLNNVRLRRFRYTSRVSYFVIE